MYQKTKDMFTGAVREDVVLRLTDNACIPNDDGNTDWQTYQVWISEGNTPLPPG